MGVLLVISASIYFYYEYDNEGDLTGLPIYAPEEQEDALEDQYSNVEELHWGHMPLTYNFDNCTERSIKKVEEAMDYIHQEVNGISFERIYSEDEDIIFMCEEDFKEEITEKNVLAEALPYLHTYQENLIIYGDVWIYPFELCIGSRPVLEIHEILHLFGLEHNEDPYAVRDIMGKWDFSCFQEISDEDKEFLRGIYG